MVKRFISAVAVSLCLMSTANAKDIVDSAVAAGNFKTLAAALQAAGLVETLEGNVTGVDMIADNGVIHVIDTVVLPK